MERFGLGLGIFVAGVLLLGNVQSPRAEPSPPGGVPSSPIEVRATGTLRRNASGDVELLVGGVTWAISVPSESTSAGVRRLVDTKVSAFGEILLGEPDSQE